MGEASFVGRATEKEFVQAVASDLSSGASVAARAIHVHGPEAIGKTALIRELKASLAGERLAVLSLAFTDPYALDPFTQLLRLRKALKNGLDAFECDAFDAAALLFDYRFRDGLLTLDQLRDGNFAAHQLLEEGIKEAVGEGGKGWLTTAISAGAGATAATASGAAGLLAQALVAGVAGIGAFGACILLKAILKRITKRAKDKRLLKDNPELKRLICADEAAYDAFEDVLPLLLARAVARHQPGSFGYVSCLLLDPADGFGSSDQSHGLVSVGRCLSKVFDGLERLLLVVTSRETTSAWGAKVAARGSLPSLALTSCDLGPLPVAEVRTWLDQQGFAETALPTNVVTSDGAGVRPKQFSDWARRLSPPTGGSSSRESEDETV